MDENLRRQQETQQREEPWETQQEMEQQEEPWAMQQEEPWAMRQEEERQEERWTTEPEMGRQGQGNCNGAKYPEWQPPKKKPGFGAGVLVGVGSTLGLVLLVTVMAVVLYGLFRVTGKSESEEEKQVDIPQIQADSDDEYGVLDEALLEEIHTILKYIDEDYLYDVTAEDLQNGILKGLVEGLNDPYSQYYTEDELSSFEDSSEGEYVGIGAAITQDLNTGIVRISKPYADTPSAEAGLLPGDIIELVDGQEVTGMDLNRVVALIKGEENTEVVLTIYRESQQQEMEISVSRRKVEIPTVSGELLENKIGYIVVDSFDKVTTSQFQKTYEDLKSQGMERVIIDMRNNGGGYVDTVELMLDYLLPEGTIFYAKGNDEKKFMEYQSDAEAALDIPCVVLVNEYTASAAEIFSGNIQAFGLGKVVGVTTYGKGVMQQMYYTRTDASTAIKLTIADYYIHGDKNINGIGITPDVEVELDEEAASQVKIPHEQDNQLQKGIEIVMAE